MGLEAIVFAVLEKYGLALAPGVVAVVLMLWCKSLFVTRQELESRYPLQNGKRRIATMEDVSFVKEELVATVEQEQELRRERLSSIEARLERIEQRLDELFKLLVRRDG